MFRRRVIHLFFLVKKRILLGFFVYQRNTASHRFKTLHWFLIRLFLHSLLYKRFFTDKFWQTLTNRSNFDWYYTRVYPFPYHIQSTAEPNMCFLFDDFTKKNVFISDVFQICIFNSVPFFIIIIAKLKKREY